MPSEINKCPACGSRTVLNFDSFEPLRFVSCVDGCKMEGPACVTEEEAVAKWNRLQMRPEDRAREDLSVTKQVQIVCNTCHIKKDRGWFPAVWSRTTGPVCADCKQNPSKGSTIFLSDRGWDCGFEGFRLPEWEPGVFVQGKAALEIQKTREANYNVKGGE